MVEKCEHNNISIYKNIIVAAFASVCSGTVSSFKRAFLGYKIHTFANSRKKRTIRYESDITVKMKWKKRCFMAHIPRR
jgi:hypothetical protein